MASPVAVFAEQTLGIKPGEYWRTFLFFLYLVLASSVYITGKTVRDTLFLSRFDFHQLPWMFVGYGLVAAIVAVVYGRVADRFRRDRLIVATSCLSGMSYVLVWLAVRAHAEWIYPAFYIWAEVIGSLFLTQFWTYANDYHTSREAKRLFGVIGAGRVLGIVVCGFAISRTAAILGTENLILAIVLLMAAAAAVVIVIRLSENPIPRSEQQDSAGRSRQASSDGAAMATSYARTVATIVFLTFLVCTLADYQFKYIAKETYSGDALAAYFGKLYAVVGGFAFVLQFFFTGRLLERLGLLVGLIVMPVCLLSASALLALWPTIAVASFLKFSDNAFQYSINEASSQLLYFPFPETIKGKIRALLDGVFKPTAYATAGAILLLAAPRMSIPALCLFTIPLTISWIDLLRRAGTEYVQALAATLRDRRLRQDRQAYAQSDLLTRVSLLKLVDESDEETSLFAVEELRRTAPGLLAPLLGRLLSSPLLRVRLAALAMAEESPDPALRPAIESALSGNATGPVQAAAIVAYCALAADEALDRILPSLDSPDPEVEEAVLVGSMKYCGLEGVLACGPRLQMLLRSAAEDDRVRAARILGRIGVRHFYRQLVPLFYDPSRRVRIAVARAAGTVASPRLIPHLVRLLGPDEVSRASETSLVRNGDSAAPALEEVLNRPAAGREAAKAAVRVLRRIASMRALEALLHSTDHEDDRVRRKILRAAAQVHVQLGRPGVLSPDMADQLLLKELRSAYQIHADRETVLATYPGQILESTFDQDLYRGLHRIFSILRLTHNPATICRVRASLRFGQATEKSNALEVLENALSTHLKRSLIVLLDETASPEKLRVEMDELGTKAADPDHWLESHFEGGGGWHRAAAFDAVGFHRIGKFEPHVRRALADPVPLVREAAAWSLARLIGRRAIADIQPLTNDPAFETRRVVHELIESLQRDSASAATGEEITMLTTLEEVLFLRHVAVLQGVPAEDLAVLAELTRETQVAAGETIFRHDEPAASLYIILKGRVEVLVDDHRLGVLGQAEVFGEMALLDGGSRSATVRAIEPTELLVLADAEFHEYLEERPEVALNVLRVLCQRLRDMNHKYVEFARRHPETNAALQR